MKLITDLQKEENMTREEANKALPTLQAFTEGKVIQMLDDRSIWTDLTEREGLPIGTLGESPNIFRIKPDPKYRPFKDAEECWKEMMKHQPFGWVKDKKDGHHALITAVDDDTCGMSLNGNAGWSLSGIMDLFNFADGVPFGVKIEDDYNGIK